jgi:NADH dehydrogenase FAD-containing subunit
MARSALGREINMAALISRNETVRAVGNMKVNARGDLVDSNNNIITSANKRVETNYNQTVNDLGLTPSYVDNSDMHDSSLKVDIPEDVVEPMEELLPEEQELFNDDDEEEIKK